MLVDVIPIGERPVQSVGDQNVVDQASIYFSRESSFQPDERAKSILRNSSPYINRAPATGEHLLEVGRIIPRKNKKC